MGLVNQKEIDEWKKNPIGPPPRPILDTEPGITYEFEGFSFFPPRPIHTHNKFENGVWVEYNSETNRPTGKSFNN